jgi:thiol-disulfide isomerase/thioredoxin
MRHLLAAATALLALTAGPLAAAPAPRLKAQSFDAVAKPLPLPYDEAANATAQVDAARARARRTGKLLLIDLGGNWCPDCRILAGTMELPDLKAWLHRHYEVVMVDVGRFNKNLQVPARYGITERLKGVPSILIVDPRTDTLLNPGTTAELASARSMSPQALANWLAKWAR